MEEVWKDVNGFEGYYQVSNFGNVRALERFVTRKDGIRQIKPAHTMSKTVNDDGYPTVKLSKDGKSNRIAVHRLVAIAFVANPDNLPEVNHIDFNRNNSKADNLEWVSHKENIQYTIDAGRHHCNTDLFGINNPNYGNTKLKDYYKNHPEEKAKLARKGAQNGRAKPVRLSFLNGDYIDFGFLRECARFMIEHNICKHHNLNAVADNIACAIKNNSNYCDCHFSSLNV